jgi:hypothetical protein
VLEYAHPRSGGSAQPLVGLFRSRNAEDEKLIQVGARRGDRSEDGGTRE